MGPRIYEIWAHIGLLDLCNIYLLSALEALHHTNALLQDLCNQNVKISFHGRLSASHLPSPASFLLVRLLLADQPSICLIP